MIFLVFAVFGQSLAQWTESDRRKRGPQGVSAFDGDHIYKPESEWKWNSLYSVHIPTRWPWLEWSEPSTESDLAILYYYHGGMSMLSNHSKLFSVKNHTNYNYFSQLIRQIWPPMTNCMPGCIESPMRSYTIWKKVLSGGFTKVVMDQHAGQTVAGWRLINGLIINCRRHRCRHR